MSRILYHAGGNPVLVCPDGRPSNMLDSYAAIQGQRVELGPETFQLTGGAAEETALQLNGPKESPWSVMIDLSLERIGPPPVRDNSRIVGVARWGTGAVEHSAEFDWRHGCRVTLGASSLQIAARYDTFDGLAPPAGGQIYKAYAGVSFGSYGSAVPTLTTRTQLVPSGGPSPVPEPIPEFARTVQWWGGIAATTGDINFLDNSGAVVLASRTVLAQEPLLIPHGAFSVTVTNTSAAPALLGFIFELQL